ncbi:MAG: hypothetical protein RL632_2093 [Bacteroidota bacterium]|jgi:hypothetical protein
MKAISEEVQLYLNSVVDERKEGFKQLFEVIRTHLPEGFEETISYGMIGWVIPKSTYPAGYHCDPKLPLPFLMMASQKNFISVYHMGIYSEPELMEWFTSEYANRVSTKLDIGKSCIRFKKIESIPFELMGELMTKMKPQDWIARYESMLKR